jgi:hypothetical protein
MMSTVLARRFLSGVVIDRPLGATSSQCRPMTARPCPSMAGLLGRAQQVRLFA